MRGKVLVLLNWDFRSPYPFLWHGRLRLPNKNSHAARSAQAVPAPAHLSDRESPWTSTCEAAVVWSLGQTMVSKWYIWGGCNSGRVCIILISMINSLYVKFFLLTIWIPKPANKPSPSVLFCLFSLSTVWIYEQGISSAGLNQEHWKVDFLSSWSRGTCVGTETPPACWWMLWCHLLLCIFILRSYLPSQLESYLDAASLPTLEVLCTVVDVFICVFWNVHCWFWLLTYPSKLSLSWCHI